MDILHDLMGLKSNILLVADSAARSIACRKDNYSFGLLPVTSHEPISKPNSCARHNFLMVWNILIIICRDLDKYL